MFNFKKLFFRKNMYKPPKNQQSKTLSLYSYKFLRYKNARDEMCPLDLSKVHTNGIKDLVSVIMPVYNGADYVAESIESVLSQTYMNFEFIIINDGSKDNTLEILNEYAKKDNRVKVYDQENRKIPKTLSRGFSLAKGEFFTWTSADNVMPDCFLEKMINDIKRDEQIGMIWGNVRFIDKDGKPCRGHKWFEYPSGSGNVIFPANNLELNTYAVNTVCAAFMYRRSVAKAVGCYSLYKHTLEDYDYWMRINSLFNLRHTAFEEPVYYYRWHDGSLTAKDEELGITKSRYKLMVLDDFRRDFYLTPLIWYIDFSEELSQKAEMFKDRIIRSGSIVIDKAQFEKMTLGENIHNFCYMNFGGVKETINVPKRAVRGIYVMSPTDDNYDINICEEIGSLKDGWFAFDDIQTAFSYTDTKFRNDLLYAVEGVIEGEKNYKKKLSVILCTYKYSETLKDSFISLCRQSADKSKYEIIFVDNGKDFGGLKEFFEEIKAQFGEVDMKYISAPVSGLSTARNAGLWESQGEYVLYIDDDAVANEEVVTETIKGFDENTEMGVIGGQIKLMLPKPVPEIVTNETRPLWSELLIGGDKVREAKDYGEFPYGANFGVRTQSLMQIGGFRCAYGRTGNNFGGGEETLVCFMMGQTGMKVGLNPNSSVEHRVDRSRYTMEHIKKTAYAGLMTQYQLRQDLYAPQDWSDGNVSERARKARNKAEKFSDGSPEYVYYMSVAEAFDDILRKRQTDYNEMQKGNPFIK